MDGRRCNAAAARRELALVEAEFPQVRRQRAARDPVLEALARF